MREDPEARPEMGIGTAQRDNSRAAHNTAALPSSAGNGLALEAEQIGVRCSLRPRAIGL